MNTSVPRAAIANMLLRDNIIKQIIKTQKIRISGLEKSHKENTEYGEVIKAWVSIRDDSDLSPRSIKEWANENMAHYKVPQHIAIIGDLPKNVIGKVQRRALQINDPIWKEKYGETK